MKLDFIKKIEKLTLRKKLEDESPTKESQPNNPSKTPNWFFNKWSLMKKTFAATALKKKLLVDAKNKELKALPDMGAFSIKKNKKPKHIKLRNEKIIKTFLKKAGFEYVDEREFSKSIKKVSVGITAVLTLVLIYLVIVGIVGIGQFIYFLMVLLTLGLGAVFGLTWLAVYVFLDVRIFQRTLAVENVFPDFLQLASANMSAGMTIDKALWYAVRPQFGVLAKEIEVVAKSTIAGEDLAAALTDFGNKYDSLLIQRSMSLLIEGMQAGGKLAELLSKIAINIQEARLLKKEMGANVTTYVIFISFATVVAAPFLFALSTELLSVVQNIMGGIDAGSSSVGGSFNMDFSGDSMSIGDFKLFSMFMIGVTSFFSAAIVSTIKNGNVKEGAKMIPVFIIISILLYFLATSMLGGLMSGFI
mgnify:CR=1 FL=1|jgi:archaeal flagellar protein FlaJ